MAIESNFYDIVLLDLNFVGDTRTGIDVFRKISAKDSEVDVIVISGETEPMKIVEIMNSGVTQFIPKPATADKIRNAVTMSLNQKELRRRAIQLATDSKSMIIGSSKAAVQLRQEIMRAAQSGVKDILLLGETGTGKGLVAKAIAEIADPAKRFIPINCAGFNDGVIESELFGHIKGSFTGAMNDRKGAFESAMGGFVFLDEIGEMPIHQQSKLLRVIQDRTIQKVGESKEIEVSFKSISATNVNIEKEIENKKFREDLYYRLSKFIIKIPALRDRIEDISDLVTYFITSKFKNQVTITPQAIELLKAYHWPGNIRQLEVVLENIIYRNDVKIIREKEVCQAIPDLANISVSKLSVSFLGKTGASLVSSERKRFEKAIIEASGDRTKAAEMLQISRATFFRRAKDLGLVNARK
jgi:DNA-binding NtrC family response regulator